ncbi:hypothetical protein ACFWA5_25145 [Streptomyces mirabilis]|uniref:hypothetical protein n=1 Tax=Streptomyces mirabilis TaxID=68239 RepID=UPI003653409B
MRTNRIAAVAFAAAGLIGTGLATAPTASAAPADYISPIDCIQGYACFHYHSWNYANDHLSGVTANYGAVFKTASNISDFSQWYFYTDQYGSDGAGKSVKNNAAYVLNWNATHTYRVYYNSGYNCSVACQDFVAMDQDNLNSKMANNNASGKFL